MDIVEVDQGVSMNWSKGKVLPSGSASIAGLFTRLGKVQVARRALVDSRLHPHPMPGLPIDHNAVTTMIAGREDPPGQLGDDFPPTISIPCCNSRSSRNTLRAIGSSSTISTRRSFCCTLSGVLQLFSLPQNKPVNGPFLSTGGQLLPADGRTNAARGAGPLCVAAADGQFVCKSGGGKDVCDYRALEVQPAW